jgi:two-component system NtrC family sensor kinase
MPRDPNDDLAAIEAALASNGAPTAAQFKKLVEVISRSQLNYRELIDHLDHAVFTLTLDGEIRVANKCLAEIVGTSFQDLIGHGLQEFIAEPAFADVERAIPEFLKQGSWSGRISVRRRKDNQLRLYDCWLQLLKDDETTSVSGWARDVTAQNESELRFTELFESLREGIIFTTPDGQLLDANPAFVRMLGYADKNELTRQNFSSLYVHVDQREKLVNQMLAKGAIQDVDIIFRRKDGSQLHTLASGFAIRDTFGKTVRLQGTIVDVTERIEIEKRLQKEQEFVRQLVASFPDMISVLDMNGCVTFVSPRIKQVLGYSAEQLVGENFGSAIHRDDLPGIKETFRQVATGETTSVLCEYRTLHGDGTWRILRASASPLFDGAGKINGVVASIRDVTDTKNSEKQASQKEKLAAMGEMMSGVAHELNNPLTAILGISDLLYERSNDEVSKRQIGLVLKQARRAATIVQNLLSFARPSALVSKKLAVEDVVRSVLSQQQILLKQKNIDVQFSAPPRLPPTQGDAKLLNQVFLNLMANAEQSILSGSGTGTIRVSIQPVDGKLAVKFLDDGPGIPANILGKVFDPFFTTKRPAGGTGLGLTICSAIIKEHGGTIEVQSVAGAGAEFTVLLPAFEELLPAPAQPAPSPRAAVAPPPGNAALKGRTVFVVDDEESIREIVQEGLSSRGMAVEGAATSEDALVHLVAHSYDFLLCDFNLPGMNGEEFFKTLRSRNLAANTKFVFMTGAMLDPAAAADFKEKGAYVLQKPFHIAALATLLVELLQPQLVKVD